MPDSSPNYGIQQSGGVSNVGNQAVGQNARAVSHGLHFTGLSPDGQLVEMIELPDHPWFVGCQFHPELKSRPMRAHPLFAAFVRAAIERRDASRTTGREPGAVSVEVPA